MFTTLAPERFGNEIMIVMNKKEAKLMELTGEEIAVLLEGLKYSIQRVSDAQGWTLLSTQRKP
jgi:hypothetical protein